MAKSKSCNYDEELLTSLYDVVGNASGWTVFLDKLTAGSFFNRAAVSLHDVARQSGSLGAQVGLDDRLVADYSAHYASVNPWLARPERRPVGLVVTSESFVPYSDLRTTEWYQDFCRAQHIDLAIGLTVERDDARSMVVSVMGARADLDRDDPIVDRLERLAPHLLRVAQLGRQLSELGARASAAEAALDGLGTAMLVVNYLGQITSMNAAAERFIIANDGVTLVRGSLEAASPREGRTLRNLIAAALKSLRDIANAPGGVMRITRPSGRAPYEVLVTPVAETTLGSTSGGPVAAIFIRDPAARSHTPYDRLQHLFGFTPAEARLAHGLINGDTLRDIADRQKVSTETLRSQLKSVFRKCGASTQGGLIRLALRGLAGF